MKILYYTTKAMSLTGSGGLHNRQFNFFQALNSQFHVDTATPRGFYSPTVDARSPNYTQSKLIQTLKILSHGHVLAKDITTPHQNVLDSIDTYDLVFCSYIHTAQNFWGRRVKGRLICDMVDSLSRYFHCHHKSMGIRGNIYKESIRKTIAIERKIIDDFSLSLITTEQERNWLIETIGPHTQKKLVAIPNGVDQIYQPPRIIQDKVSPNIGFIGSLDYFPNIEALNFISKGLSLQLKAAGWNTFIIGHATNELRSRHKNYPITFRGFVLDLEAAFRDIDVVILPLKIVCGIQNKLLSAMALGKVALVPKDMVFDIELIANECLICYDDRLEIPRILDELRLDTERVSRIQFNAKSYCEKNLTWKTIYSELFKALNLQ